MGCTNSNCDSAHSACVAMETTSCPEGRKDFRAATYKLPESHPTAEGRQQTRRDTNLAKNIVEIQKQGMKAACANGAYWGTYGELCHAYAIMVAAGMVTEKSSKEKETVAVRVCNIGDPAVKCHSKVWVLTIDDFGVRSREGDNGVSLFTTEQGANDFLIEYVREQWPDDEEKPDDTFDLVDIYFRDHSDGRYSLEYQGVN